MSAPLSAEVINGIDFTGRLYPGSHLSRARARARFRPARLEGGLISPGLDRAPAQPLRHGHSQAREGERVDRDLWGAVRSRVRESLVLEEVRANLARRSNAFRGRRGGRARPTASRRPAAAWRSPSMSRGAPPAREVPGPPVRLRALFTKSHSRPHVSDDNPYSEAQFKTLKYQPDFPARFDSIENARAFCQEFFAWYNHAHRHSGIGYMTPGAVHTGQAPRLYAAGQQVLDQAFIALPERFTRRHPTPPLCR